MTRTGRVAWLIGGLLVAAAVAVAPGLAPPRLFPLSILVAVVVVVLFATGIRAVHRRGGVGATAGVLLVVGAGAAAVGVDWPADADPRVPCRRNPAWLPSYLLRPSPTRAVSFEVGTTRVKVCYGSPRTRGRRMIGAGPVPYGALWRTGANEPTTIRSSGPITVAGIPVDGKASLYTVPGPETWELIVNASTAQWGLESEYSDAVRARELGRTVLASDRIGDLVEALAFEVETGPAPGTVTLTLLWEHTVLRIPIVSSGP